MNESLKSRTTHGLYWSFLDRIGQQGIQFIISVILARLLLPEQYGLIAMLSIFMAVAQGFIDSGFNSVLIQKKNSTHLDECTIFYFNLGVSLLAVGLLWIGAPLIAAFYKMPSLIILTRVLSVNLVIYAFESVQTALLTKHINFKMQMKLTMTATILSGTIGVILAYKGFGIWSLVVQSIIGNAVRTGLLWFFQRWRPSLQFSFQALSSMYSFGSKLFFSGLLEKMYNNLFALIIGKVFSAADLGFYARANQLQQLPAENIAGPISRVTYPVFSSIQDDKPRLKRGVRKALATLVMFNFPLMVGLASVAKPLVVLLLTKKWLPCVPYLQLLCGIGMLYPLHVINLNVLMAQGRSDLFFRLEILKKIVGVTLIAITYRWGILIMIAGQIVGSIICYFINSYYSGVLLEYPIKEQLQDLWRSLALSTVMGMCVYLLGLMQLPGALVRLMVQVAGGTAIYCYLCWAAKLPEFLELWDFIKLRKDGTYGFI